MAETKTSPVKKKKYNDADTRKPGSPIETPFKYNGNKKIVQDYNVVVFEEEEIQKNG